MLCVLPQPPVCRAIAGLAAPLKSRHAYRPTQDPGGAHRALLQRLIDTVLRLAAQQVQQRGAGAEATSAVLEAVQGVLAVEHRPIQSHLSTLWALLLAPAPDGSSGDSGSSNSGGAAAAVAVACGLVGAYAELRQLEILLDSLADALLGSAARGASGGAAAEAAAAAAAGVAYSAPFLGSLRAAVRGLPSGQAAAAVRWVAGRVGQLAESDPADSIIPVLSEVSLQCSPARLSVASLLCRGWQPLPSGPSRLVRAAPRCGPATAFVALCNAHSQ